MIRWTVGDVQEQLVEVRLPQDILDHDGSGDEQERLSRGAGRLEALRTRELLRRWLPSVPAVVLDVGGAAGRYALPLAAAGYQVHLLDPVQLHVEQAAEASRSATRALASVRIGDASTLPFPDASADAVLLLGPLYHLTLREERLAALREARRVQCPGGVAIAAAISRFASTADGIVAGYLRDPEFATLVADDVNTGVHRNPSARHGWFTTAYFHRPEELRDEVTAAGLQADGPVAVEGLGWSHLTSTRCLTTHRNATASVRQFRASIGSRRCSARVHTYWSPVMLPRPPLRDRLADA
jgi:ubiquinone/menaquinone biosynthesis C-methylase UbiE